MLFIYQSQPKSLKIPFLALTLILAISLFFLLSPQPTLLSSLQSEEHEFQSFSSSFSKTYSSDSEYNKRFSIFRQNLAYIRVFNSLGDTVILGVNEFADMDFEEFRRIYLPSKLQERESTGEKVFTDIEIPESVDWRTQGAVTPVKNQGQCGSCWAFSTTGSTEGAWFLANHTLTSLSEQQLVDCSRLYGNKGCNGGTMDDAFRYIIANKGITTEANYPYTAEDGICDKNKASQAAAVISNYTKVASKNPNSLQIAVAQQPVSVGVEADQAVWQLYRSGTITQNCGTNLDHGVLIVGYSNYGSPAYWIVKNSWGSSWGMAGYLQIMISSGAGVCGINLQPSFPIV